MASLDEADFRILRELRDDGRASITELARRVHVSRPNVYSRLQRLEADGVIRGYSARVDPAKVGLPVMALIMLGIDHSQIDLLRAALEEMEEVVFAGFTTGEFDGVVIVRVKEVDSLRHLVIERLRNLPGVKVTQSVLILEEVVNQPPAL
jgi:Lrp/AsnC family transcriptional regulator, leucine-responsive regulatory protein